METTVVETQTEKSMEYEIETRIMWEIVLVKFHV